MKIQYVPIADTFSAAIQPGTDVVLRSPEIKQCGKCGSSFVPSFAGYLPRIDSDWCGQCNDDITHDLSEDRMWAAEGPAHSLYMFAGWRFSIRHLPTEPLPALMLYKRIPYPEAPGLIYSFACSNKGLPYCAAWLIGHWWEHALKICPCQNGVHDPELDQQGTHFRQAMIESLLWYHNRIGLTSYDATQTIRARL